MEEKKSILHELYVFSEWKPEQEYLQKPDSILPENISALWRWLKFFGPKKSLIDSVTAYKERQQKWHIALGDEGKVIAVLTDNILEIRTKRSEYATIAARTTVSRDPYAQWRKLVWSPDCSFLVLAYGNGIVSFFDLTASSLFSIPTDCNRPGGLECTDNTHAVADIIFMPLRVKDNKWDWEVLIVTFDGKLRGCVVSQSEGCQLRHASRFPGGVSAVAHCGTHAALYVAGVPGSKEPSSSLSAGLTAWRILNDEPWYTPSVVSQRAPNARYYTPFTAKNLAFVVRMAISPDHSKLVCVHCNGDVSVWRVPALQLLYRWPLQSQPQCDLKNPLVKEETKGLVAYQPADVNWWTNEEIILSRFSGAVTVCDIKDLVNILGKKPEFFQGTPQVTCAYNGTFMVLECESTVLPTKRSRSDDSLEAVEVTANAEDSMLEVTKEMVKSVLYALTDIEAFQPKPKRITVVSRVYRLLGVKSTTPGELFARKIESGSYAEALSLAATFHLDSDLVYQQQWRKHPVSAETIHKYLSKVSKKIWAVHQCVDRLPETLPAAKELLQFGLKLTNERILDEINKDRPDSDRVTVDSITLEHLNASTSELLRCRHLMLFYSERLRLYEAVLKSEKSTYVKDEYHRLRSNTLVHSAMDLAKEGRIDALTCLWPYIRTVPMQLSVLDKIPETISPSEYQDILPKKDDVEHQALVVPISFEYERDWCRKEIFRSIWSSNWSEDSTPEKEKPNIAEDLKLLSKWYESRAREIEDRCGLISNAIKLLQIASLGCHIEGLEDIIDHFATLEVLVYKVNVEGVTLEDVERMSHLEICKLLVQKSTAATLVSDLKELVLPYLQRCERRAEQYTERRAEQRAAGLGGLVDFLESLSEDDLSTIYLILNSQAELELDVRTHLELAERCILAYRGTDQLDMACDLLGTILKETDGSISNQDLIRRITYMERLVSASSKLSWRKVRIPPRDLKTMHQNHKQAHNLLTKVARSLTTGAVRPTQQDWEKLLAEMMDLQATLFGCVTKQQCFEIYASSLLTSGDAASIKLAAEVLTCEANGQRPSQNRVAYKRSVELVDKAAKEYFNSASSLTDPALELARSCLLLIKDDNQEIRRELDLIAALHILSSFRLTILPIQVRLCENKMTLIEDCLKSDPNAFMASHKLLKVAKLFMIADDDEETREGLVLQLVGEYAIRAGPSGHSHAADAARRLCALRHAPAADLVARVAREARAHVDNDTRRQLYAAAATYCRTEDIEDIVTARLSVELEGLEQMGAALKAHNLLERNASADEEFADAVTTPVIEKKDLVAPPHAEKKGSLLTYLLSSLHRRDESEKSPQSEPEERSVHCQAFYGALYPELRQSRWHYRYETFALPGIEAAHSRRALAALKWYYVQNCVEDLGNEDMEIEVVTKCAEEVLYKDTPLSVACLLLSLADAGHVKRLLDSHHTDAAVCAVLYATLVKCNGPRLRDNVYRTPPAKLARTTLEQESATEDLLEVIRQCLDKLSGMGDVDKFAAAGFTVNRLMFNADEDYRREMIYRLARSDEKQHLELACSLAAKHGVDALEVWLQHAAHAPHNAHLAADALPHKHPGAYARIKDTLWPLLRGDDHNALIGFFNLLKSIDDKACVAGLTANEHVKLLKKAKAASPELNYKLLVDQPSAEEFSAHILEITRPENVGLLTKFLRTLPPSVKAPVTVNAIYTAWLTKYFFSVPPASASTKKWMQQYRQCASYFNKLAKEDLLEFVANTCFTPEAIERVPHGTRNLMIMQAVDYCQQEQENDFKVNKNEQSWAQVGKELAWWARFLDNFHSTTVQGIIDGTNIPRDDIWPDIEASHGDRDKMVSHCARLVLRDVRPSALGTLLQCLHVDATPAAVLHYAVHNCIDSAQTMSTLVRRMTQFHKEGVKLPDDLIDTAMQKATEHNLPAHEQISLLSLSNKAQVQDSGDLTKIAHFSVDLVRSEWRGEEFVAALTEEKLTSEEGRREVFSQARRSADSWQRKKALVDILSCWPVHRDGERKSIHFEYLQDILKKGRDQKEALVLIKLVFRRPVLDEQEVNWLTENLPSEAVINAIWIVLLSKCQHPDTAILRLIAEHEDFLKKQQIEDELIKELLDRDMFLKLVPTPIYSAIINFIMLHRESDSPYTVSWASNELYEADFLAEAGHLNLLAMGVPAALRGFSQAILYAEAFMTK